LFRTGKRLLAEFDFSPSARAAEKKNTVSSAEKGKQQQPKLAGKTNTATRKKKAVANKNNKKQ